MSKKTKKKAGDIHSYFIPCEMKPGSPLWSVLDPFAYDIKPAFIFGSLGVLSDEKDSYAVLETSDDSPPLLGYVMTITNKDTELLLDKIKSYDGPGCLNKHEKIVVKAHLDLEKSVKAFCYVLSETFLKCFMSIEQMEFGLHDEDEKLEKLLDLLEDFDIYE